MALAQATAMGGVFDWLRFGCWIEKLRKVSMRNERFSTSSHTFVLHVTHDMFIICGGFMCDSDAAGFEWRRDNGSAAKAVVDVGLRLRDEDPERTREQREP